MKQIQVGRDNKKMVTIRIPPKLHDDIKQIAGAAGTTYSAIIEAAFGTFIDAVYSGEITLVDLNGNDIPVETIKNYKM